MSELRFMCNQGQGFLDHGPISFRKLVVLKITQQFVTRLCIFCAYTRQRYQVSVYRTISPLVLFFSFKLQSLKVSRNYMYYHWKKNCPEKISLFCLKTK